MAAAGDDADEMWLLVPDIPHPRRRRRRDVQPPVGDAHDDDVDGLLDEISPPVSDLDERILDDPTLLAMVIVHELGAASWEEAAVLVMLIVPGFGGGDDAYRNGGFGAVPASASAVAELKKGPFRTAGGDGGCGGGVTGCAICLEDFEDGEEVTVMPCDHGHEFHPNCITEWLGCSNMCPLCRHPLPTGCEDDK